MRNTGCAALDLAYVGCGRFDGYFHDKINLWDVAAGLSLIRSAGGKFSYKRHKDDIFKLDVIANNDSL